METKKINIKHIHMIGILLGAILMLIGAFHSNIWFDEAYTVGLINHPMMDMIQIAIHDVHPVLYYILTKLFSYIFGASIISLRIFSVLGMIVLSIVGYTHVRKDFGEKTGFIFSCLVNFLPIMLLYSNEIRMYSWAAVFVTLTAIYLYRIYRGIKQEEHGKRQITNWILFSIFSVCSAYTHYFAMMAIGVMNLVLMAYILKNKKQIKVWIASAISQIILFIPGLIIFLQQAFRVSHGFWIKITYPDIFLDILTFELKGVISSKIVGVGILVFASLIMIYLGVKVVHLWKTDRKKAMMPLISLGIYLGIIVMALLLSNVTDIFTTRYTIPMVGLLLFFVSYFFAREKNKWIHVINTAIIVILCLSNTWIFYHHNYDKNNMEARNDIQQEIQKDDIFIYQDINVGSLFAIYFSENNQYFYNKDHWTVEDAYQAFGPQMKCIEELSNLEEYHGRIWIIDHENQEMYHTLKETYDIEIIKEAKQYSTSYKGNSMTVLLVNK